MPVAPRDGLARRRSCGSWGRRGPGRLTPELHLVAIHGLVAVLSAALDRARLRRRHAIRFQGHRHMFVDGHVAWRQARGVLLSAELISSVVDWICGA